MRPRSRPPQLTQVRHSVHSIASWMPTLAAQRLSSTPSISPAGSTEYAARARTPAHAFHRSLQSGRGPPPPVRRRCPQVVRRVSRIPVVWRPQDHLKAYGFNQRPKVRADEGERLPRRSIASRAASTCRACRPYAGSPTRSGGRLLVGFAVPAKRRRSESSSPSSGLHETHRSRTRIAIFNVARRSSGEAARSTARTTSEARNSAIWSR